MQHFEDEEMQIVKRDGTVVPFNKTKIRKAIISAMRDGGVYLPDIARIIANDAENYFLKGDSTPTISQVEKYVFSRLIHYGQDKTAKAYEAYRAIAEFRRQNNTTDDEIYEIVRGKNAYWNSENSNKNPELASTQRDYIAGAVSKDTSFRKLFPTNIIQAHMSGAIHLHDLDYAIQPIHNCFSVDTKFITIEGMKAFSDFQDGDIISVLSLDGKYHNATVKKYGTQKLYEYTFYCGKKEYTHNVKATENHRWILKDGSETTNLKIGDKLCKAPIIYNQDLDFDNLPYECQLAWCKGFGLGDGVVEWQGPGVKSHRTRIRLCGEKDLQYLNRFNIEGCNIRNTYYSNGDKEVVIYNYQKEIPNFNNLLELQCFFNGLYCADGNTTKQNGARINYRLQSSKPEVIDFIRQYADVCGLYITRERDVTGEVTNFGTRPYTIYFSFNPDFYFNYTVLNKQEIGEEEVWCLEVEDTHNFILQYGIPTGNCCLINIKDMFEHGTVINGTAVKDIKSFQVACTVLTQIIAAIASGQFGGQSVNIKHLGKYLKLSEDKYYEDYKDKVSGKQLDDIVQTALERELRGGVQTIQYQINTISCSNGQTPFVTLFLELDDNDPYLEYTAKIIYEILRQRYNGIENEFGTIVTPTFPKLIFVLDENNIHPDSRFRYIYDMAIKSSARRMYPDYISAKVMREQHNGQVFSPMGCR